ncbi:O-acyltransferase, WSD1 domain-containing protein [Artemisia annua]|uniref:O-acyltransferase, WSD1 domain-containing protein n=2 Tax=Artemisia annua TaxID=35608 RepID=A0A2U1QBX7_ARTAN|nr:O-acyltransferase, WSD1 domain-containing protein [Artemisia annua]
MNSLRGIRTTKEGETYNKGFKKEEENEQPLSPMARLFHEPGSDVYIIGIMGSKTKICPQVFKDNLALTFLKNRRFCSLQVMDKENGSMEWIPTHVNIDDHVIIAKLDPNMESSDKFIEDYISNLTISPMENTKPLWDLHILDVKTQETEGTCVFRFHHSLGDGISLMNLLLSCTRKVSDPEALPTLPGNNKRPATKVASIWSGLGVLWNSLIALLMFVLTALFLKDTSTPMKGSIGVERKPRRFLIKSVSLADIKMVKEAMNVTINDVVLGVTQAGISRYLHRRYSEDHNGIADVPDNIRLRATNFFNLRATTRVEDFTDMNKHGTWGNKIGYALLSLNIGLKKDPLDNVRDAKAIMERKKTSLEPLFTYFFTNLLLKLFGMKAAGKLNYKVFFNTTLWFSNVPGPQEEISFFGHKVAYLAPSCYGQPCALMIHVVSYMDKVTFVLSVDEETIPDPHKLCDDLQESLDIIKASAQVTRF